MSQDNQNENPQDDRQHPDQPQKQGEEWQGDPQGSEETLESRGTGSSDSPQDQAGSSGQSSSPELEESDEMDDEDRDDDSRADGSPNRRNNIG
jgi:hypothetical protein